MRLPLAALLVLLTPPASADALDRILGGIWGSPEIGKLACAGNAKRPELLPPDLLRFHYDSGIEFPPGRFTTTLDYRILARGADWLVLEIPGEYREYAGKPVVWRLEFVSPDRFEWHIEGSPDPLGDNPQIRCGGNPTVS